MKVSVCMATYNGEKYIEEQLHSILIQLESTDEVIISDDYSSDDTVKLIKKINDQRIKIYYNQRKKGYTSNFENALHYAQGEYIFISDQDDVWLPGKVKTVIAYLQKYDLAVTNSKITDEHLNVINESFFTIFNSGTGIFKNLIYNTYYGSCMAFKKKVLDFALPFPKNREVGFDLWIGFVSEIIGKVIFIDEPFLLYRRSDSTVTTINKSNRSFLGKLYKRLIILFSTIMFFLKLKLFKKL